MKKPDFLWKQHDYEVEDGYIILDGKRTPLRVCDKDRHECWYYDSRKNKYRIVAEIHWSTPYKKWIWWQAPHWHDNNLDALKKRVEIELIEIWHIDEKLNSNIPEN